MSFIKISDVKRIEFGLTSLCNAGCPICSRHKTGTSEVVPELSMSSISLDQFIKTTDSLGEYTKNIEVSLGGVYGDPISNPHILEILEYGVPRYNKILLDTNGGIRNSEFWKQAGKLSAKYKNKFEIKFSIDGLSDTNVLYRINTDFDRIIENAKTYIAAGGRASWKYIVFEHNEHQLEEAKALADELGFIKFRTLYTRRFRNMQQPVTAESYSAKINRVSEDVRNNGFVLRPSSKIQAEPQKLTLNQSTELQTVNCKSIEQGYLYISHDNKLWPCCYFDGVRLFNNDFLKYWRTVEETYGQDFNSLDSYTISELLEHDYLAKYLPQGWTGHKPSCKECFVVCGESQYRKDDLIVTAT